MARTTATLAFLVLVGSSMGCDDITVCALPESDNGCHGDGDCLLVYCGISCCPCEWVASRGQFDQTYCMVEVGEGFTKARSACSEARDTACDGVSCTGANACPHPTRARCDEEGRCVAAYD